MTPQSPKDLLTTLYSKRRERPTGAKPRRQRKASAGIAFLLLTVSVSAAALMATPPLESTPPPPTDAADGAMFQQAQFDAPQIQRGDLSSLATRQTPPTWVTDAVSEIIDTAIDNGDFATASIEDGDYSLGAVVHPGAALDTLNRPPSIPALGPAPDMTNLDPIDLGEIATGAVKARSPVIAARPRLRPTALATLKASTKSAAARPQLSIVLASFGLNHAASRAALHQLPREIAVAVAPVAENPAEWITAARAQGRAALIEAPLETHQFPWINDSPYTLLTEATSAENLERLRALHARAPGADGVATYLGDAFADDPDALRPVLRDLASRGLAVVETAPQSNSRMLAVARELDMGLHRAASLDAGGRAKDLEAGLEKLEAAARRNGRAIGVALATPATVEQLAAWLAELEERGVVLAPLEI